MRICFIASKANLASAYRISILSFSCAVPLFLSIPLCKIQLTAHLFNVSQNNLVCINAFLSVLYLLFASLSSLRHISCIISYYHLYFSLSILSSFGISVYYTVMSWMVNVLWEHLFITSYSTEVFFLFLGLITASSSHEHCKLCRFQEVRKIGILKRVQTADIQLSLAL